MTLTDTKYWLPALIWKQMLNLPCPTTQTHSLWEAEKQQSLLKLLGIRSAYYVQGATVTWIEIVLRGLRLVAVLYIKEKNKHLMVCFVNCLIHLWTVLLGVLGTRQSYVSSSDQTGCISLSSVRLLSIPPLLKSLCLLCETKHFKNN